MLSFHIKFVQTDRRMDRQTDNGKTICPPIFRYGGIKMLKWLTDINRKSSGIFQISNYIFMW